MVKRDLHFRYFGKVPLCNHRAESGIYIHGFCLPLCFRCTGILLGAIAGTIALQILRRDISVIPGAALILPTAIDGFLQYFAGHQSTNRRRMITGLLAGVGCAVVERGFVCH